MKFDLKYLLSPLDGEDFFENYYEKKPLFIKREQQRYYNDILNITDINDFIGQANLLYPAVRIVKNSEKVASEDYTFSVTSSNSVVSDNIIDKDKLFFYFYNGYTIILNSLERQNLNLLYLRHEFEKTFYSKAQCNVYLTPKNSQGFPAHFDLHDVFVLQLHGSKEWSVYDSPIESPNKNAEMEDLNWIKPGQYLTALLQEGDLLYIPRGFVHEAKSQDEVSLHLTLGIPTFKYADVLTEFVSEIENNLFFRKSLPIGFNPEQTAQKFKKYLSEYLTKHDLQPLINNIQTHFVDTRLNDATDRLNDYLKIASIDLSTRLGVRKGLLYKLEKNENGIELRYHNKTLKFPVFTEAALEIILKNEAFGVKELNKIDNDSKIRLCRKLIEEGFLVIIN